MGDDQAVILVIKLFAGTSSFRSLVLCFCVEGAVLVKAKFLGSILWWNL